MLQGRWHKVLAFTLVLSACATPFTDANVRIDFPPTERIVSVEQADAALETVKLARAQIEWRFRQKENICYNRFFMNACLLDAKEQRRTDLARVKIVDVEANRFKRQKKVEELDRELAKKNNQPPPAEIQITEPVLPKTERE
jgi:hypothetical protein